jgi:hypothetical protein
MVVEWSRDFSYSYFRTLLKAILDNFDCHRILEAPQALERPAKKPAIFLRHDIDIDLRRALRMAQIEHDLGVRATYMVIVDSPLYRVEDADSRAVLNELESMGHEIALHFVVDQMDGQPPPLAASLEQRIQVACERLEKVKGTEVRSVSFHRPRVEFLRGDLTIAGRINAYSRTLMAWYLSDSRGRWREGDPLPKLLKPTGPLLQLLIHPIWWGDNSLSPEDRLQRVFLSATKAMSRDDARAYDQALSGQIGIQRSGGLRS